MERLPGLRPVSTGARWQHGQPDGPLLRQGPSSARTRWRTGPRANQLRHRRPRASTCSPPGFLKVREITVSYNLSRTSLINDAGGPVSTARGSSSAVTTCGRSSTTTGSIPKSPAFRQSGDRTWLRRDALSAGAQPISSASTWGSDMTHNHDRNPRGRGQTAALCRWMAHRDWLARVRSWR